MHFYTATAIGWIHFGTRPSTDTVLIIYHDCSPKIIDNTPHTKQKLYIYTNSMLSVPVVECTLAPDHQQTTAVIMYPMVIARLRALIQQHPHNKAWHINKDNRLHLSIVEYSTFAHSRDENVALMLYVHSKTQHEIQILWCVCQWLNAHWHQIISKQYTDHIMVEAQLKALLLSRSHSGS